jgi:hypothetical protein
MKNVNNLNIYHLIFQKIREKPRFKLKDIADILQISGRGKTKTTASKYLTRIYERKISLRPNLILKNYENSHLRAYFLSARSGSSLPTAFEMLDQDSRISYVLFLSGKYDFLVTTRYEGIDFKEYNLRIKKESFLANPIFTIPKGWNSNFHDAIRAFSCCSFKNETHIDREIGDYLPWEKIHYSIFSIISRNVQVPFSVVGRSAGLSSNTVKRYYERILLPYCFVSHYFFPEGYDNYDKSLIILRTDYETELVNSLGMLPCTTYVYPLEEEIVLMIFHKGINDLMCAFKKLKREGYISNYYLFTPLHWW